MKPVNQHVVLIGMMGVGKSTVGRLLARRLGWGFWDNDEALSRATGETAAEVQQADGQEALHRLENRLLREALADRSLTVFAAAASVVLEPELLSGAVTVWLRVSAAREAEQIAHSGQHHRPLPADAAASLLRIGAHRAPLYARLADITVDVAAQPAATCDRLIEALGLPMGLKDASRHRS
jgi:shikimate kinase